MEDTPGSAGPIQADNDNDEVLAWSRPEAEVMGILMEGKRRCKLCGKGFNKRVSCIRHLANVHKIVKFKCHRCNRDFASLQSLKNHQSGDNCTLQTNQNIQEADVGVQKVTRRSLLPRKSPKAAATLNKAKHKCDICDKKFTNKLSLINHHSSCHERVILKCERCGKIFTTMPDIQKHQLKYCRFRIQNPTKENSTLTRDSAKIAEDQCSNIDVGEVKVVPWIPETIPDFDDGGATFSKLEENEPSGQLGQVTPATQMDIKPYANALLEESLLPPQFYVEPEESPKSHSTTEVKIEDPLFDVS